jgi:hypothetical protein
MLKRRLGPGAIIVYRNLGAKYRVLSDNSAYPEASLLKPANDRGLVLLDQEEDTSGSP